MPPKDYKNKNNGDSSTGNTGTRDGSNKGGKEKRSDN